MSDDIRLGQLMCSRLCHDMVGSVGAITAGLELAADEVSGADVAADAVGLSRRSADEASRRLAFFRAAFGLGWGVEAASGAAEARRLAEGYLAGGRVSLAWPDPQAAPALPGAAAKLSLGMILIGAECLPRGGELTVVVAGLDDGIGLALTATGTGAQMRADVMQALQPEIPVEALSARTVHAYVAQRMALEIGGRLEAEVGDDEVRLAAIVAAD